MTKETMTIHQALVELKTLDKRIATAIRAVTYVVANKHSNNKISGIPVKEYVEGARSQYQKVNDLLKRREAIKRAVVKSNAVTEVVVAGKTYTVAEAIDMKNHGVDNLKALLKQLTSDYTTAKMMAERSNGSELERRADEHVRNMYGVSDMKGFVEEAKKVRAEFIEAQTMELLDPIGVVAEINRLEAEINEFEVNVDAALSVSNALTSIEIDY